MFVPITSDILGHISRKRCKNSPFFAFYINFRGTLGDHDVFGEGPCPLLVTPRYAPGRQPLKYRAVVYYTIFTLQYVHQDSSSYLPPYLRITLILIVDIILINSRTVTHHHTLIYLFSPALPVRGAGGLCQ